MLVRGKFASGTATGCPRYDRVNTLCKYDTFRSLHGFTLVELLVVIAIISFVVLLLLPAVQAAREAARQAQCSNSMKQLGLACANYESTNGSFPPSSHHQSWQTPGTCRTQYANWVVMILPFLEQQTLFDSFDLSAPISDSINRAARGTELQVMKCPSDTGHRLHFASADPTGTEGDHWARGNYAANASLAYSGSPYPSTTAHTGGGVTSPCSCSRWHRGIMGSNLSMGVSEVFDGTSNTILLGEIRVGVVALDRRGTWALGGAGASALWAHGWAADNGPNPCNSDSDNTLDCPKIVTAAGGIKALTAQCMTCASSTDYNDGAAPRSRHPGGVHVAMADGAIRFISNYIEKGNGLVWASRPNVTNTFLCWQRLCCSQDGQIVDGSKF